MKNINQYIRAALFLITILGVLGIWPPMAQAIIRRVDGIYISNDNTVVSALNSVSEVAMKHKIPVMSAGP